MVIFESFSQINAELNRDLLLVRLREVSANFNHNQKVVKSCELAIDIIEALEHKHSNSQEVSEQDFYFLNPRKNELLEIIAVKFPTDTTLHVKFKHLHSNITAASLLVAENFNRTESSTNSLVRAETALRLAAKEAPHVLSLTKDTDKNLKEFFGHLVELENDENIKLSIRNNRFTPWRTVVGYALGYRNGKLEFNKEKSQHSILCLELADSAETPEPKSKYIRTNYHENQNNAHFPKDEAGYDAHHPKGYILHPLAKPSSPTARSPILQNVANHRKNQRIVMDQVLTGNHPKALSQSEIKGLLSECLTVLENPSKTRESQWGHCLMLLLSLTLGRSIESLKSLKSYPLSNKKRPSARSHWVLYPGGVALYSCINIPRKEAPSHISDSRAKDLLHYTVSKGLLIPVSHSIAPFLIEYLRKLKQSFYLSIFDEKDTLAEFESLKGRQVTIGKIGAHLENALNHSGIDSVIIGHVCGKTADQTPALYYTQVRQSSVVNAYNQQITAIGLEPSEPVFEIGNSDSIVGSILVPRATKITSGFNGLKHKISGCTPKSSKVHCEEHHNYVTLYSYMLLTLVTGHRPVGAPFEYLRDFDLDAGFVWISDKVVRTNHASRILPLGPTAVNQVRYYINHLEALYTFLLKRGNNDLHAARDALDSYGPLFFLFTDGGPKPLSPEVLKNFEAIISLLPQNWQRHFLRSHLTNKIDNDTLNSFMGHALIGVGPMSRTSGFCYGKITTVAHQIEKMVSKLKISPLKAELRKYSIEQFKKGNPPQAAIGRVARKESRKGQIRTAINKFENIEAVRLFTPEDIDNTHAYAVSFKAISSQIDEIATTADQRFAMALNFQSKAKKIATTHKLKVSLPAVPTKLFFEPSFRDEQWFSFARYIHVWEQKFLAELSNLSRTSTEGDKKLVGLILYSAITLGGLTDTKMVYKLAVALGRPGKTLQKMGPYLWFDLVAPVEKLENRYSVKKGDECCRLKRWFPDEISLALLLRFYKKRGDEGIKIIEANTFGLIKKSVFGTTTNNTSIKGMEALTKVGFWLAETKRGLLASESLQAMASYRHQTFSQDEHSWKALFNVQQKRRSNQTDYSHKVVVSPLEKTYLESPTEWGTFYEDVLRPAISPKHQDGIKVPRTEVKSNLTSLTTLETLPGHLRLLVDWTIDNHNKGNSLASIRRYCSTLIPAWILEADSRTPNLTDAEDLRNFYSNILEYHGSAKETSYQQARLAQIHQFGMRHSGYLLPHIEGFEWHNKQVKSRTRTAVLSINHVQTAIALMTINIPTASMKKKVLLLVTLAYRTGMRIGELIKLMVRDVENSGDYLITIRSNKFGDNKSLAARRRINTKALLNEAEFNQFKKLVRSKRDKKYQSQPLFNFGASSTPLTSSSISRNFSDALSKFLDKNRVVFHTLRHSCFSIMHAVLEEEYGLAKSFCGLEINKLKDMRIALVGPSSNQMGSYYALAAMAGHAGPKETMSSYLHLTDLILFKKIQRLPLIISKENLARIAGIQAAKITSLEAEERYEYLARDAVKLSVNHAYNPNVKPQSILVSSASGRPTPDFELIGEVLDGIERGVSIRNLAFQHNIEQDLIRTWKEKAHTLHAWKTRQSNSKVSERTPPNGQSLYAVKTPNDTAVRIELQKLFMLAQQKFEAGEIEDLKTWAFSVLKASSASDRRYLLHSPEEVTQIITFLNPVIAKSRWLLEVTIPDGPNYKSHKKEWKKGLLFGISVEVDKVPSKIKPQYPKGIAHLRLSHPYKQTISGLPKMLAFPVAIAYLEIEELEALTL